MAKKDGDDVVKQLSHSLQRAWPSDKNLLQTVEKEFDEGQKAMTGLLRKASMLCKTGRVDLGQKALLKDLVLANDSTVVSVLDESEDGNVEHLNNYLHLLSLEKDATSEEQEDALRAKREQLVAKFNENVKNLQRTNSEKEIKEETPPTAKQLEFEKQRIKEGLGSKRSRPGSMMNFTTFPNTNRLKTVVEGQNEDTESLGKNEKADQMSTSQSGATDFSKFVSANNSTVPVAQPATLFDALNLFPQASEAKYGYEGNNFGNLFGLLAQQQQQSQVQQQTQQQLLQMLSQSQNHMDPQTMVQMLQQKQQQDQQQQIQELLRSLNPPQQPLGALAGLLGLQQEQQRQYQGNVFQNAGTSFPAANGALNTSGSLLNAIVGMQGSNTPLASSNYGLNHHNVLESLLNNPSFPGSQVPDIGGTSSVAAALMSRERERQERREERLLLRREKKSTRERQRRLVLNTLFEDLTNLLFDESERDGKDRAGLLQATIDYFVVKEGLEVPKRVSGEDEVNLADEEEENWKHESLLTAEQKLQRRRIKKSRREKQRRHNVNILSERLGVMLKVPEPKEKCTVLTTAIERIKKIKGTKNL